MEIDKHVMDLYQEMTQRNKNWGTVTCFFENGHCSECGACCSRLLPLTREDIRRIKKYVKKHDVYYTPLRPLLPMSDVETHNCPFLNPNVEKHRCTIYPARPEVCRVFDCKKGHGELPGKIRKYQPYDMYKLFNIE